MSRTVWAKARRTAAVSSRWKTSSPTHRWPLWKAGVNTKRRGLNSKWPVAVCSSFAASISRMGRRRKSPGQNRCRRAASYPIRFVPPMRTKSVIGALTALMGGMVFADQPPAPHTQVPGITQPVHDSLLSASAAGTVQGIHFKQGDAVETGALILERDTPLEELEVARRRSGYESRAELEVAEHRVGILQADYESTKR